MLQPFLSVIIPACNCKGTIEELLNSIFDFSGTRELTNDMIEVLIIDDKSTDDTISVISSYMANNEIYTITVLHTDKDLHCPGNTREVGLLYASGEWITFIDHDDCFSKDGINIAYDKLKNEKYFLSSGFSEYKGDTIIRMFDEEDGRYWLHGKFFNKKNLLEPSDVHFMKDMVFLEDVYFMKMIYCYMKAHGLTGSYVGLDNEIYMYKYNENSTSRTKFSDDISLSIRYTDDLSYAMIEPYIKIINRYSDEKLKEMFKRDVIEGIMNIYLFIQLAKYKNYGPEFIYDDKYFHDLIGKICYTFKMTRYDIIEFIFENPDIYYKEKQRMTNKHGVFIEEESIRYFIMK